MYERIKECCKLAGISVNELEKIIGASRGALCKIDKHTPSADKIQKIASVLNVDPYYILYGNEYDLPFPEVGTSESVGTYLIRPKDDKEREEIELIVELLNTRSCRELLISYAKKLKDLYNLGQ